MTSGPGPVRRALFLLHHYNDIDHAAPVADALLDAGWKVGVVLYPEDTNGSFDAGTDWRLRWLREKGAEVRELEELDPGLPVIKHLLALRQRLMQRCDKIRPLGRALGRDLRGLLPSFLGLRLVDAAINAWAGCSRQGARLLEWFPFDVLAVDWARAHLMVHPTIASAQRKNIKVVELPHGAWTYVGTISHDLQRDPAKLKKKYRLPTYEADAVCADNVPGALRLVARGWRAHALCLSGLPRFTSSWVRRMLDIAKPVELPVTDRPRAVWFAGGISHSEFEDALGATVDALRRAVGQIDIVIKLHTRVPKAEREHIARFVTRDCGIRVVGGEMDSLSLTSWADTVLIGQSSAVYDAFLLDKNVFHLHYTQPVDCLWNQFGVGEKVTSAQHLDDLLRQVAAGSYRRSEPEGARRRFMQLCVNGGLEEEAVLPTNVTLFEQLAEGRAVPAPLGLTPAIGQWKEAQLPLDPQAVALATN